MAIQHVYSQTVADGTATSVVRPSDWNSNHKIVYAISGNTAGSSNISGQDITFVGGNNCSLSADTANSKLVFQDYAPLKWVHSPFPVSNNLMTNVTALTQRPIFVPIQVDGNLTADELMWPMSRSTSGSNHFTMHVGLYKMNNGTSMNLLASSSASYSASNTASQSGVRMFEFPMGANMSTLTRGQYVLAAIFSATATASMNYSLMGHSTANPVVGGVHNGADTYWTHTSHHHLPMWGRFSTTTGALPSGVAASHIIGAPTGASMALPWAFTIASDY